MKAPSSTSSRPAVALLAAALCASLLSCTSSGDGGLGGGLIAIGPTWTSDAATGMPSVELVPIPSGRTRACFDVQVESVLDLYSIAFSVRHDPAVMTFSGATAGSLLGAAADLQVLADVHLDPAAPGTADAVVGVTRQRGIHGTTGVSGNGPVARICFELHATSPGVRVDFVPVLRGENGTGGEVIPASQFFGGTVVIE